MELVIADRLATLGHAPRLAVYRLLMRRWPDEVPAGHIADALDLRPNTASVYLSALLRAGLVVQRRDGTRLLYKVNMETARALMSALFLDGLRGRADLLPELGDRRSLMTERPYKVLFVCTGNSARSIFAETLLRDLAGDRFEAFSAGTAARSDLNPIAVEMLEQKGHATGGLRAKSTSVYQGDDAPRFDFVFTVCDLAANEDCPPWPDQPISGHWSTPDPARAEGTPAERRLAFQTAYGMLRNRIEAFVALPISTLDRASLQHRIDEIGMMTLEKET
ncbi:helix-turn-helix domain-containing protein [Sulfitobacter sp. D35]|uniref:arsenate reductase/protein-tyrosine-phosphatase family protein n=1 Tax=Sulfitobacter sp. D35 TaxID=3083252 RepID=UPI00296F540F|nr:helix-turn-helix domain-containing protein [Sulfitobacter sp. D35]MDW4497404.1 helix-turn-helix domain-containing protein [Sulfitobacter sp. D35]